MSEPLRIYRKDYKTPPYQVSSVELHFELDDHQTKVHSKAVYECMGDGTEDLFLDGEDLDLLYCRLDGEDCHPESYLMEDHALILKGPLPEKFTLEIGTQIDPANNLKLEGLYKSGSVFCTQMEAEGFRRVTFFQDRPDVMTRFKTTIDAPAREYPQLLSNGNRIHTETLPDGRHRVVWEDPFPKPCYLFALVAGNLGSVTGSFKTMSGRDVQLEVFVDKGNEARAEHALASLQKAMAWDEKVYGLEYDLDLYMIVAVDAFNFGAMENKGLNIFNSSAVLADPTSATDSDYQRIEGVVAHEYFHNWTGNRVTCRDWFQLTLKEGLTVFRDQQFSADTHNRAVFRIHDVNSLREMQFIEDGGPNAHPIQPHSYMQINNFYTSTVYDKGAEVIRMIHTILGPELFRKGMDLYFQRHDGHAVTTQDFVQAMEDGSGIDLKAFESAWYHQAGTPRLLVTEDYDDKTAVYRLRVEQIFPDASGENPMPYHIPIRLALLAHDGTNMPLGDSPQLHTIQEESLWEIKQLSEELVVQNVNEKPILSFLRGFSAPVKVEMERSSSDLLEAYRRETDDFCRFEVGQVLMKAQISKLILGQHIDGRFLQVFRQMLCESMEHAIKAELMGMPSLAMILEEQPIYDPSKINRVRENLLQEMADFCRDELLDFVERLSKSDESKMTTLDMGRRALINASIHLLSHLRESEVDALLLKHYHGSTNMSNRITAMSALVGSGSALAQEALDDFEKQWQGDAVVMNKWFAIQASSKQESLIDRLLALEDHPSYNRKNPNKVRSLWGSFRSNLVAFHKEDGSGYDVLATRIMEIDAFNSGLAAGLAKGYSKYTRLSDDLAEKMASSLKKIMVRPGASRDVVEIISNTLSARSKSV